MRIKLLISIIVMFITVMLAANQITIEMNFEQPVISASLRDGYNKIEVKNCVNISNPGYPDLPHYFERLILPPGESIDTITILESEYSQLNEKVKIIPSQQPYPLSYQGKINFTEPINEIYKDNKDYPEDVVTSGTTQFFRGIGIGNINVSPVRYNPVSSKISYLKHIKISITTTSNQNSLQAYNNNFRATIDNIEKLETSIEHSDFLSSYSFHDRLRTIDSDYLIITENNYIADFDGFVDWKTSQGYNVLIKTVEDIYSEYTGYDNADKIRKFITYAYQNLGTEYVLLGGDVETIPHRGMYLPAGENADEDLPSDLYYAGLDNNGTGTGPGWNADNDNYWGETDEADYYAEVFVGRISADSHSEFAAALNKQIMYQSQPVDDNLLKAVMVGEKLDENPTYGGNYKDEIINGGTYNGYYTAPFGDNFDLTIHYDKNNPWAWSDLKDSFNAGTHLVNHLGHSNTNYNMRFSTSYVTNSNLTSNGIDSGYYIIYSQGCYPAAFDNRNSSGSYGDDCIVEAFTTINNGCVAFLGNTRYGWYNPSGTNASSQYLDRQFFDAIFADGIYEIAKAHENSRFESASQCDGSAWFRWTYYEVTLFGDPSLDIWTDIPTDFTVTHNPSLPIGSSQIAVNTNTIGARVALIQNGELIGRGTTGSTGNATIDLEHAISSLETIDVCVNGHNKNQHHSEILVISNQPYIIHQQHTINDLTGNNNGQADFGENLLLDFTFENVGNQNGYNIQATLSSDDTFVTITDDNEIIGTLNAETSLTIEDCFAFNIANNITDQHQIDFVLTVTGNSREDWISYFSVTANAPDLELGDLTIDDTSGGNGNGRLDPGETVQLNIICLNNGHLSSPSASATVSTESSYLTIDSSSDNLGIIADSDQEEASFSVSVDANTPIGTPIDIITDLTAGNYQTANTYYLPAGIILEDFETDNFASFPWELSGTTDWITINTSPHEGLYCAKSGTITNNQSSILSLTAEVVSSGDISFYKKVSSESGYDFLKFYIDDVEQTSWSGEVAWSQSTYPVSAGEHTFKWLYVKDNSVSNGNDCGWIDYIILPSINIPEPPHCNVDAESFDFQLSPEETTSNSFNISNIGESDLQYFISTNFIEERKITKSRSRNNGGPDTFGNIWKDSNDIDGPTYNWVDISNSGTELSFSNNDNGSNLINIGFTFPFYGSNYSQFRVNPNGWIGFADDKNSWSNQALPYSSGPLSALFLFWDDLHPYDGSNGGGHIYYQASSSQLIVQFEEVEHYGTYTTGTYTFQVIIQPDGTIKYQYKTLTGNFTSCTVGMQNDDSSDYLQMTYNSVYLENNLAIEISNPTLWLSLSQSQGVLEEGEIEQILLNVTSEELEVGEYQCEISITSNDPDNPTITMPVSLVVSTGMLGVPQNLVITIVNDQVHLSWDTVAGATGYNVYTSDKPDSGFILETTTVHTSWVQSRMTRKFYKISAIN